MAYAESFTLEQLLGLTHTELDQLREYVRDRERTGIYWGNKAQFDKRDSHIRRALQMEASE